MQTILTRKYLCDQFDEEFPCAGLHTVTSLTEKTKADAMKLFDEELKK